MPTACINAQVMSANWKLLPPENAMSSYARQPGACHASTDNKDLEWFEIPESCGLSAGQTRGYARLPELLK